MRKSITMKGLKWLSVVSLLAIFLLPTQGFARTQLEIESSLINSAGMQRMLSQRITKDYLYLGAEIRMGKSRRQMKGSISLLLNNHGVLKKGVKDSQTQSDLTQLEKLLFSMKELSEAPFSIRNAAKMLKLSDEIMLASQIIVDRLGANSTQNNSRQINIAGRQRMLSQRISKLYIAYQSGFQDSTVVDEMRKAVELFDISAKELAASDINTKKINSDLTRTTNLWKTVRPYFVDIKTGGYEVTVFVTTDAIMRHMNNVTRLYVRLSSKKKAADK